MDAPRTTQISTVRVFTLGILLFANGCAGWNLSRNSEPATVLPDLSTTQENASSSLRVPELDTAQLVSFEPDAAALPFPPADGIALEVEGDGVPEILGSVPALDSDQAEKELSLGVIQQSVLMLYPQLAVAERERVIADGKTLSGFGAFDVKAKAASINQPLSFYQNYRQEIALERADFKGGKGFVKYRIGDGFFEPWYGERDTDEGGEFSVGYSFALAKDRMIDEKRAKIMRATFNRQAVEPFVRSQLLQFVFNASDAYWSWVAAGHAYNVQKQLLELAVSRNANIERQTEVGDLPKVELIDNERLIADRQGKLVEQERKLQQAAIKLSLYLRDAQGNPWLASLDFLPDFSEVGSTVVRDAADLIPQAVSQRPELAAIDIDSEISRVDLAEANNLALPVIDAFVNVKKDVGGLTSSKGDKRPLELIAGVVAEMPIQRREASGLRLAAQGKLSQLAIKRRFAVEKIFAEIQDALSALRTAEQRIIQAEKTVELALQSEKVERRKFELKDSTLVLLNLREEATVKARLDLIQTKADYYKAQAQYQAAMGNLPADVSAGVMHPK
jgi:outer membrane protein TolC